MRDGIEEVSLSIVAARRPVRGRKLRRQRNGGRRPGYFELLEERTLLSVQPLHDPPPWQEEGPGPITGGLLEGIANQPAAGAIQAVAPHPFNPNIVFVGTVNGGVWRTLNAATPGQDPTWQPLTDHEASQSIGAIAISPFDKAGNAINASTPLANLVLYAGTGSVASSGIPGTATGILKSVDGGNTWSLPVPDATRFFNGGNGLRVTSIVPSRANPNVVLASTIDATATAGGIYRSTDGGVHWKAVAAGSGLPPGHFNVTSLVADPSNAQAAYAAIPGSPFAAFIFRNSPGTGAGAAGGVYRTTNDGMTWTAVNGAAGMAIPGIAASTNIKLAVSAAAPNPIYAGLVTAGGNLSGLFRSVDQGAHWAPLSMPADADGGIHPGNQGEIHFSIVADPANASVVVVGGDREPNPAAGGNIGPGNSNAAGCQNFSGRVFRGTVTNAAGATTWFPSVCAFANSTAPHADSRAMAFDAVGNILEADDGGLFKLSAPGDVNNRVWLAKNGNLRISEQYSVAYDRVNDVILAGAQDNSAAEQRHPRDGFTWNAIRQGDGTNQAVDVVDANTVLRYSMENTLTAFQRRQFDASGQHVAKPNEVVLLARAPATPPAPCSTFVVNGLCWLSGLTPADANAGFTGPIPFAVDTVDSAHTRLLIARSSLYESKDRGDTVTRIGPAPNGTRFSAVLYGGMDLNPSGTPSPNPGLIYAARGNQLFVRPNDMLGFSPRLVTAPPGACHGAMNAAGAVIPDVSASSPILDLAIDPDNRRVVYAVDGARIFKSADTGITWCDISGSLSGKGATLRSVEVIKTFGLDDVLIGGKFPELIGPNTVAVGGIYHAIDVAPTVMPAWTRLGADLPNILVTDLDYDAASDVLVAATLGRGAWTLRNAKDALDNPVKLLIQGDDNPGQLEDQIYLRRDPAHPLLLEVFVNHDPGTDPPDYVKRLSTVHGIEVLAGEGDDTVTVDGTDGLINVADFLLDGGAGQNTLRLIGAAGQSELSGDAATGGTVAESRISGAGLVQRVAYQNVATVDRQLSSTPESQLRKIGDGLLHAGSSLYHSVSTPLSLFGTSIARALDGAPVVANQPLEDPTGDTGPGETASAGTSDGSDSQLLRRLIETGLGGFPIADIGDGIDTPQDLRDRLDALDDVAGNVTLTESAGVTRYDVEVQKRIDGTADLDIDTDVLGGTIQLQGTLDISAAVTLHLVFGVDAQGFFIDLSGSSDPVLRVADLQADGELSASGRFGFLGVDLGDITIASDPDLALEVRLSDPGSGMLRIDDLKTTDRAPVTVMVAGNPSVDDLLVTGEVDVSAILPGAAAPFTLASADVSFTWPDITNPSGIEVSATTSGGEELLKFLHVTPDQVLKALNKAGDLLDKVRQSDTALKTEIPFTHGTTVGQAVDVADAFRKKVTDLLDGGSGTATFGTVQDLADKLSLSLGIDPAALGIHYDPTTHDLTYHLNFTHDFDAVTLPVDFSVHAGTLASFQTNSSITLTPHAGIDLDFGVNLGSLISDSSLSQSFFIKDPTLSASIDAAAPDINATAQIASVVLHVMHGTASARGSVALPFEDPGTDAADGRISLNELTTALTDLGTLIGSPSIQVSGTFSLPVSADPLVLGGVMIALAGTVSGTTDSIDYALTAALSGTITAGFVIEPLPSGAPSRVTFSKANGLALDARARVSGVDVSLAGQLQASGDYVVTAHADPFPLGQLTVQLDGSLSRSAGVLHYTLTADVAGQVVPGLVVRANPTKEVTLSDTNGLGFHAIADAFGITLHIDGGIAASGDFSITASADPFDIGGATVTLAGSLTRQNDVLDYDLTGTVANWNPVPFLTVQMLLVRLDTKGIGFETTTTIAGVSGIHLVGDFRFADNTYKVVADLPVDWSPVAHVNLSNVHFSITNRNADDTKGDVRIGASADLHILGSDFLVTASVTGEGEWLAATPTGDWTPLPIPGFPMDHPFLVVSTYDFVLNVVTLTEITPAPAVLTADERAILAGINLLASGILPDSVPGVGGSAVQVAGTIPADLNLAGLSIEAKIVLAHPPVIADLFAFTSVGLRITGTPSLSIFGQGVVLHEHIPGLSQDVAVQAALTLDILNTTLSGSLSLLSPIPDFMGIQGLNILSGDGEFGINFATTPLPLPTIGFDLVAELPAFTHDLGLPTTVDAALKISTTTPIVAITVTEWAPFAILGIDDVQVHDASIVVAPNGGTIGTRVFPRGFSGAFDADILGTTVHFLGLFNQETKGIIVEGSTSSFTLAGIAVSGAGCDGVVEDGVDNSTPDHPDPDADNGPCFTARLTADTPNDNGLFADFDIDLPGQGGLTTVHSELSSKEFVLHASVDHWTPIAALPITFNGTLDATVSLHDNALDLAFDVTANILGTNTHFVGDLSASPSGYQIYATATISLAVPSGPHIMDLAATIDIGKDSPFAISVAADFTLPGTTPADVHVEGGIDANGFDIFARVNKWQLVPGLSFNGSLCIDAGGTLSANCKPPAGSTGTTKALSSSSTLGAIDINPGPQPGTTGSFTIRIDVDAYLLASRLNLKGVIVSGSGGLDLDLDGNIHFGGALSALATLNLDAHVVSQNQGTVRTYGLALDGDLRLFSGLQTVHVDASYQGDSAGNFTITVHGGYHFGFDLNFDPIKASLNFDVSGDLRFGSNPNDLSFGLKAKGSVCASAKVAGQNLGGCIDLVSVSMHLDVDAGDITIPGAKPTLHYPCKGCPPTGFSWKDLHLGGADTSPPSTTVTAQRLRDGIRLNSPFKLKIVGGSNSERVEVTRVVIPLFGIDTITVRAATGTGELLTLLSTPTDGLDRIDVDMGAGNDTILISSNITLPTLLVGGTGSDTVRGGNGPNTIYGGKAPSGVLGAASSSASLAADLPGGGIIIPPIRIVIEPDGADELTGGSGNDVIFGDAGNDTITSGAGSDQIDGGAGIDLINGRLELRGSDRPEQLEVYRTGTTVCPLFRTCEPPTIRVREVNRFGTAVGLFRAAADTVTSLDIDAGGGNDSVTVSPQITLPALLVGGAGDDSIHAGNGPSTVRGGDGDDQLYGGSANDSLAGEAGNDWVLSGGGNDLMEGGDGNDQLIGAAGNDTQLGGSGDDSLIGGDGNDSLSGGDGNDTLAGGNGDDTLDCGTGDDVFDPGTGTDQVLCPVAPPPPPPDTNQPPVLDPIGPQSVDEHATLAFTATAHDPDTSMISGSFSAADDFSETSNPTGPWSYGWKPARTGTFHSYPNHGVDSSGLAFWNDSAILSLGAPSLVHNGTGATQFPLGIADPPNQLIFHPGTNGENSVFRWTAPASGTYQVTANFSGFDSATTDVSVLHDDQELFSGAINGQGSTQSFAGGISVQAGDTIDFTVGNGGNGFFFDSTTVAATIVGVAAGPSPTTLVFSLDPGAPDGASIDPSSGVFTWMPGPDQLPGVYQVTVRVSDNGAPPLSDAETIDITVSNVNDPPELGPLGDRAVTQQSTLEFVVTATDPDPGETLTFSLDEGAPTGASIDPATGMFHWTPSLDQPPGDYALTVLVHDSGSPALEDSATFTVTVNALTTGSVRGAVFEDANKNGVRDEAESGVAGWPVFLDSNGDGKLNNAASGDGICNASATESCLLTAADGTYVFANLEPGSYRVRQVRPTGWQQTTGDPADAAIAAGAEIAGVDFGNFYTLTGKIKGRVFEEIDGDFVRDANEPFLVGWTVFLDLNQNGARDASEPTALTNLRGAYVFKKLAPGNYTVALMAQPGYRTSTETVQVTEDEGVGDTFLAAYRPGTIVGKIFQDDNANGIQDPGELRLSGRTVFVDLDGDGLPGSNEPTAVSKSIARRAGKYTLRDLAPGTYEVLQVLPDGWEQTLPAAPGGVAVTLAAGGQAHANFGARPVPHVAAAQGTRPLVVGTGTAVFTEPTSSGVMPRETGRLDPVDVVLDAWFNPATSSPTAPGGTAAVDGSRGMLDDTQAGDAGLVNALDDVLAAWEPMPA